MIVTSNRMFQSFNDKLVSVYQSDALNAAERFDSFIDTMDVTAIKMYLDRSLEQNQVSAHAFNEITAINTLRSFTNVVPFVESCAIYYPDSEVIYSSKGKFSLYLYGISELGFQASENFVSLLEQKSKPFWASTFEENMDGKMIYFVPIQAKMSTTESPVVMFILTRDSLINAMQFQLKWQMSISAILDSNNQQLYIDTFQPAVDFSKLVPTDERNDIYYFSDDYKNEYIIYFVTSEKHSFKMFLLVPKEQLQLQMRDFEILLNTLTYLMLAICFVAIVAMIYFNYLPIKSMKRTVGNIQSADSDDIEPSQTHTPVMGEFEAMLYVLQKKNLSNKKLAAEVRKYNSEMVQHVGKNLLLGGFVTETEKKVVMDLLSGSFYFAVVMHTCILSNEIAESSLLRQFGSGLIVEMPHLQHLVIILDIPNEAFAAQRKKVDELSAIIKTFDENAKIGVGDIYADISDIDKSYLDATIAYEYRARKLVVYYKQIIEQNADKNSPVEEHMVRLRQAIHNSDRKGAYEELELILKIISLVTADHSRRKQEFFELIGGYYTIFHELELTFHESEIAALLKMRNMIEIEVTFKRLIDYALDENDYRRVESEEKRAAAIVEYVDNNFMDSNLSINVISQNWQIAEYTISRIFKKKTGVNFSSYIINKRINKAKELLIDTDLSIKQIGERIGLANDSYFIKLFKHYEGVTPSQYRKNAEQENKTNL